MSYYNQNQNQAPATPPPQGPPPTEGGGDAQSKDVNQSRSGGYPPQGYPPQGGGYPPQGYPPQGYPQQGYGYPPQGYPAQGYPPPVYTPQYAPPPPQQRPGGPSCMEGWMKNLPENSHPSDQEKGETSAVVELDAACRKQIEYMCEALRTLRERKADGLSKEDIDHSMHVLVPNEKGHIIWSTLRDAVFGAGPDIPPADPSS